MVLSSPRVLRSSIMAVVLVVSMTSGGCAGEDDRDDAADLGVIVFGTVAEQPTTTVGGLDDRPGYVLGSAAAARFVGSEGAFVVLDAMAAELRYFDSGGQLLSTWGGKGGGPGEFQTPFRIYSGAGDSVHVFDISARRVTTVSLTDGGVRTTDVSSSDPKVPFVNVFGTLRDGTPLVNNDYEHPEPAEIADGVHRLRQQIVAFRGADGKTAFPVAVREGSERFHAHVDGGPNSTAVPFGRSLMTAAGGDRIVFGSNEAISLTVLNGAGDSVTTITEGLKGRAITQEDRDSLLVARERSMERMRAQMPAAMADRFIGPQVELMNRAPVPDTMPVHGSIQIDSDDRIWVALIGVRGAATAQWLVYGPDGARIGALELATEVRLLDAAGDRVLLAARDELDVESVSVHAVVW